MRVEMSADDLNEAVLEWAEKSFPNRQSANAEITIETATFKLRVGLKGAPRPFTGPGTSRPDGTVTGSFELGK